MKRHVLPNPSRDAYASELCLPPRTKIDSPPAIRGRRSAERRMPTMCRASQTSVRSLRHSSAARLRAVSGRARLPALRPRLSQGLPSLTQLQAMLPATWNQAGVTRPIPSQSSDSTSRLGRSTEGNDARSRSGADCESARKHRTRSTLQIASGMRPSMSEIPWLVPDLVTDVKYRRDNRDGLPHRVMPGLCPGHPA